MFHLLCASVLHFNKRIKIFTYSCGRFGQFLKVIVSPFSSLQQEKNGWKNLYFAIKILFPSVIFPEGLILCNFQHDFPVLQSSAKCLVNSTCVHAYE